MQRMRTSNATLVFAVLVGCAKQADPQTQTPPAATTNETPTAALATQPMAAAPSATLLAGRLYRTGRAQAGTAALALCADHQVTYVDDGKQKKGRYDVDGHIVTAQFGAETVRFEVSEDLERITAPGDAFLRYLGAATCGEAKASP